MATTPANKTTEDMVVNETTTKPLLVDLKNGKAMLKQKPISYDKASETMSELVKFREILEEHTTQQSPQLDAIPEIHLPLVAKLVQESDKTLSALTKSIHHTLLPPRDEDEDDVFRSASTSASLPISLGAVERAITTVAVRTNYGLDKGTDGAKVPAALCVWRWEVKEAHREWLPKSAREKADGRLAERVQAKKDLQTLLDTLPQSERDALLKGKQPLKEKAKPNPTSSINGQAPIETEFKDANDLTATPQARRTNLSDAGENDESEAPSTSAKKRGRSKKPVDPEKEQEKETEKAARKAEREAKEKEKADKKAAQAEKAEKEKKAQDKSRNIMASFFGASAKPKTQPSALNPAEGSGASSTAPVTVSLVDTSSKPARPSVSDFQRTFKPFVVKKGAEMAAQNWFQHTKSRGGRKKRQPKGKAKMIEVIDVDTEERRAATSTEVIELSDSDHEDIEMTDGTTRNLNEASAGDHLRTVLSTLPRSLTPNVLRRPPRRNPHIKTHSAYSVRTLMAQLSEAEVSGDDAIVRRIIALLGDRDAIPARVLCFHEDERPGYYGTFTRTSSLIGPRAPLAKDAVALDYGYDSGEEWEGEEEVAGEDVHDEDAEEDEDEEQDSDIESWLVDDDEVEEAGTPLRERMMRSPSPFAVPLLPTHKKRKPDAAGEEKREKKRKVVVPLVPFAKGPCWESEIGACEYEPFEQYRVQLLNNVFAIDPFTYVSEVAEVSRPDKHPLPSLLDPRTAASGSSSRAPSAVVEDTQGKPKPPKAKPKSTFPDAHVPLLLARITSMGTSSVLAIVEALYAELKEHKVKKNAIEAKVKEVGEKCKERKVWVVKTEIKTLYPQLA